MNNVRHIISKDEFYLYREIRTKITNNMYDYGIREMSFYLTIRNNTLNIRINIELILNNL